MPGQKIKAAGKAGSGEEESRGKRVIKFLGSMVILWIDRGVRTLCAFAVFHYLLIFFSLDTQGTITPALFLAGTYSLVFFTVDMVFNKKD